MSCFSCRRVLGERPPHNVALPRGTRRAMAKPDIERGGARVEMTKRRVRRPAGLEDRGHPSRRRGAGESTTAARLTLQPGWRWSECIKPVVGTDSCQARHVGFAVSGRIRIEHDDGTTADIGPGDAYLIAPGHEAWVVGDEPFVGVEFKSAAEYAKG